jgi:hypothetical protein
VQRLLHRERLLHAPAGALVDRARDGRADAGERVQLLDGRVGAVRHDGARLEQRAERVRAFQPVGPEALREVAVGGSVGELDRARDAELREAGQILRVQALRVLDAVAQPARSPFVLRRLERVERLPVRAVADRVHRNGPAGAGAAAHDVRQLLAGRDAYAGAVEHPRGLRAQRAVHEHLQVAEPQELVAEARADVERLELGELLPRQRLPYAKR